MHNVKCNVVLAVQIELSTFFRRHQMNTLEFHLPADRQLIYDLIRNACR
jgi:hypothetical protein